ncbi:MAG TPA: hypothetical protein VHB46_04595 [Burkholderiales bacterium]|nr:hypothetical protein [Burkholderiales bacterium]
MDFLFELLFQLLLWIAQFLAELLLQILAEALGELFVHAVREPFRRKRPPQPWLAAIGYGIFGGIAGGLSLWAVPFVMIDSMWLRWVNLAVTPLLAGIVMSAIGNYRRSRSLEVIRLDSFGYGYCFALAMALVRFTWGR